MTVLVIWACGLLILVVLSLIFNTAEVTKEEHGMIQLFRKSYHWAALYIFLPSGIYNLALLQFGLVAASCLFILVEASRVLLQGSALAEHLDGFMTRFTTDEEEKGRVLLPHLMLLIGCSIPIMIASSGTSIHTYAGVFALSVTDAFAALIGSLLGEHRWPGSKKTAEGTFGALAITYIFYSFITELVTFEQTAPEMPAVLAMSLALPLWEGFSDQNDNLTLPVVAYALSTLLF